MNDPLDNIGSSLPMNSYEDGLREGRIRGIEETVNSHGVRLDMHDRRITAQERITYALLGAIALIELLPTLKGMVN